MLIRELIREQGFKSFKVGFSSFPASRAEQDESVNTELSKIEEIIIHFSERVPPVLRDRGFTVPLNITTLSDAFIIRIITSYKIID